MHAKAGSQSHRISWFIYGLLPYALFTVAFLHSDNDTDSASMWSACEQMLGNGGAGCLFSIRSGRLSIPRLCKQKYAHHSGGLGAGSAEAPAVMSMGDGLSINRNLIKLCTAIHAGLLDDTLTYHIGDAQALIRLAYYMMRPGQNLSMDHAVHCEPCLNATAQEYLSFYNALERAADVYERDELPDLQMRLNRMQVSYFYPRVRVRPGYVDWHGVREFLPGAGRLAKGIIPSVTEHFRKHVYVARLLQQGELSDSSCIVISAVKTKDDADNPYRAHYMALHIWGWNLHNERARIDSSMRLNIVDLDKLHEAMKSSDLCGKASEYFRHPMIDEDLARVEFDGTFPISKYSWGQSDIDFSEEPRYSAPGLNDKKWHEFESQLRSFAQDVDGLTVKPENEAGEASSSSMQSGTENGANGQEGMSSEFISFARDFLKMGERFLELRSEMRSSE